MEAVRKGDIPGTPAINGTELYWWKTIYFQAASFKMGDRDLNKLKKLA